jgi:hypothetical protein
MKGTTKAYAGIAVAVLIVTAVAIYRIGTSSAREWANTLHSFPTLSSAPAYRLGKGSEIHNGGTIIAVLDSARSLPVQVGSADAVTFIEGKWLEAAEGATARHDTSLSVLLNASPSPESRVLGTFVRGIPANAVKRGIVHLAPQDRTYVLYVSQVR